MKSKPFFFRLFAILIGTGIGLIILAVVRPGRELMYRTAVNIAAARGVQAAKTVYHQTPFYFAFKEAATNMHGHEPFTEVYEFHARHNSQGFRTPEYTIAHPPNTFRIVVLGDSFTWGQGVAMEQIVPHVLENMLNGKCSKFRFEVIALGVRGHRMADNLIKLVSYAESLKPDLVVFQVCENDVDFYDYVNILRMHGVPKFELAYMQKEREILSTNSFDRRIFTECLTEIRKWSQKNSVPISFLIFPIVDVNNRGHNFNHYKLNPNHFPPFGNIIHEIEQTGFASLSLTPIFRDRGGDQYLAVSATDGHPNALAHRLAAEALVTLLEQNNLVGCASTRLRPGDSEWPRENALRTEAARNWTEYNTSYMKQARLFEELRSMYPQNSWIAMQLGDVYFGMKRWHDAYDVYSSLADSQHEYSAPWFQMANCAGDQEQREVLLEKTLKVLPDHTLAMQDLADIYLQREETQKACGLLLRITQIPSTDKQYDRSKELYNKYQCQSISGPLHP